MRFYRLTPGAPFEFCGKEYTKTAVSMAADSDRLGSVFQGRTHVTPLGEPLLLPETESQKWTPSNAHWTEYMSPAPGER
jgi:hypothetical protein